MPRRTLNAQTKRFFGGPGIGVLLLVAAVVATPQLLSWWGIGMGRWLVAAVVLLVGASALALRTWRLTRDDGGDGGDGEE